MTAVEPGRDARGTEHGDASLVERAIGGDHAAYGELVRRHQQLLYRHARGMGLDHDTSLDLVQDAMVRANERLGECRTPGHFRAWVFRICRNLCLDHLKSARHATRSLDHDPTLAAALAARDDDADLRLTLRTALDRLSVPLREAFLLRHQAGYDYDEIAALIDASPSAAKMRVHRARETLQQFLVHEGVTVAGDKVTHGIGHSSRA